MALIEGISTEAAEGAAKTAVDESAAKLLPQILAALQPVIDAAQELRGTLCRVNGILDRVTGVKL